MKHQDSDTLKQHFQQPNDKLHSNAKLYKAKGKLLSQNAAQPVGNLMFKMSIPGLGTPGLGIPVV